MKPGVKTALYIGRFQPFHLGHLNAIEQIVGEGYEKIIIGIGSSESERTDKNPFTYYERKEMISIGTEDLKNVQFEYFPIPDFGDNERWTNYIVNNCSDFQTVYSGNCIVEQCFLKYDKKREFRNLEITSNIKATQIRQAIANKSEVWKKDLPEKLIPFVVGKLQLLEQILKPEYKNPALAVDGIVRVGNSIVLIERKNKPFGYALPGGFVDYGESCEDAIRRELKEEISLDISNEKLFGVYSKPDRDPRQHIVSVVYEVKSQSLNLVAGDDASRVLLVPFDKINKYTLAFDHRRIIEDYLKLENVNS